MEYKNVVSLRFYNLLQRLVIYFAAYKINKNDIYRGGADCIVKLLMC